MNQALQQTAACQYFFEFTDSRQLGEEPVLFARVDERFPKMDPSSAVFPTVRVESSDVAIAYYLPGCDDSAVVIFRDVVTWGYGGPNDEGLASHPLCGHGLTFYEFHNVGQSDDGDTKWLATFHDGVFEIVADRCEVIAESVKDRSPGQALDALMGLGENIEL
jgi:hypothetical protein